MEGAAIFKLLLAVGGFAVWAYRQLQAKAEQPAAPIMAAPPPIPRRARKPLAVAKSAAKAAAAPHLDASDLVVTRPARALARSQFRGTAALRQAIVAREVLGPPLCLRPPRY